MFISKIYILVPCLTPLSELAIFWVLYAQLCFGVPPIPPDTEHWSHPGSAQLLWGTQWHVETSLEPRVCQLQVRKMDFFAHKRCICMNEFLIVAKTVKSGSTQQSKEMDLSPQLQLMVSAPSGKSMSPTLTFLSNTGRQHHLQHSNYRSCETWGARLNRNIWFYLSTTYKLDSAILLHSEKALARRVE